MVRELKDVDVVVEGVVEEITRRRLIYTGSALKHRFYFYYLSLFRSIEACTTVLYRL
jgi:hypothetical protein